MIFAWPQIIAASVLTVLICYGLHSLDIDRVQSKAASTLASQMQFDIKQCESQKQITSKSETDYETAIAQRDADIKRLRNQPTKLVYITKPASSSNAANQPNQPSSANAIDSGRLYDFSGECEADRIKVNILQSFITQERK